METDGLTMGTAKRDVTPPAGLLMAGYGGREDPAVGTHLPLWARATVCAQGDVRIALVGVDVVGINREKTGEIRRAICAETGILEDRILIATTHTHSGPVTTKFRDVVPDPAYMRDLSKGIVGAVAEASEGLTPVRIGFAQGEEPEFHHNRRNEGEPIDSTLGVVRFVDGAGRSVAIWVNYGCHPTILTGKNLYWSTDFAGVMCNILEETWGGVATFFNGCLGDVGPYRSQQNFAEVEQVGGGLAGSVLKLGEGMVFGAIDRLSGQSVLCAVPLEKAPDAETLRRLSEGGEGPRYAAAWARDQLRMREAGVPVVSDIELEVQGFHIGDVFLACFSGQLFGAWGLDLRRRWPDDRLLIINQANDHAGYFPSKVGWDLGGYEANSAFMFNSDLPAPMTWEAGQELIHAALGFVSQP